MLARLQKIVVWTLGIFGAGCVLVAMLAGHLMWLPLGLFAPAAAYVAVIAFEFYLLWRSFAPGDATRPLVGQLFRAFTREITATPRIFLWWQPFRSHAEPDWLGLPSPPSRSGVLLLHGFVCNRGIWTVWMRRLRGLGVPYIAVDLEPVFGAIGGHVTTIDRAVSTLTEATGRPPIIVAHSMGGLAARAWLATFTHEQPCHALVTLGTPHRGTWMARNSRAANGREMRIDSAWLSMLAEAERTCPPRRVVCFWSRCDNIVFPSRNATLPGADNRDLEATPHVQMIHHPDVFAAVLKLAAEPPTLSTKAGSTPPPADAPKPVG